MNSKVLREPQRDNIENILQHQAVLYTLPLQGGTSEGIRLVVLDNEMKAVWKPWKVETPDGDFRSPEVLAYHMDKLLGINQVPPTVERVIDGKRGSLQLYVPSVSYDSLAPEARGRILEETQKQFLFDMIIGNTDRFGDNTLYTPEGRVISIDHGYAFNDYKFVQIALI